MITVDYGGTGGGTGGGVWLFITLSEFSFLPNSTIF